MSSSLSNIENIETLDDRSFSDVGIQVDLISHQSFQSKSQHFVDLGYDSLHSTPKLLNEQKVHSKHFDDNEDADETISENSSVIVSKWRQKFSKLRTQLAIRKICKDKDKDKDTNQLSALRKIQNSESEKIVSAEPERLEWGKKIDFLLSIIGFAVDLSNVWRFPYLAYKNGGGVFLIPYTIMLVFGALPLFFLELSVGQFARSGPISLWSKICPPMKGIGYCCVLISWYVSFYYNVIIAWTTYYVFQTLMPGDLLPWQHCNNNFNTPNCFSVSQAVRCDSNRTENQLLSIRDLNNHCILVNLTSRTSPTEEFFLRGLLEINKSDGLSGMGTFRWQLIGCLVIVFCALYFSLFKGVKSSGKVVWVTATAPYFILTILLIRGLFLPGAGKGIMYYINPQMDKLLDPSVWTDAAVQVFYSIGVGFGVHLTYASFNKFNNNCYRDCLITASVNSLTSFYSGFVIFTYLGYMADSMNKKIEHVATEGYGLIFQVYPEALSTLPFARFWSLLFFFMLITLGIDSAMGGLEAVITGLIDEFNIKRIKREYFTAIVISTSFFGALINCTQGGGFTMFWFDYYAAGISLLCSAMFEAIAVTYFYGSKRFCSDIHLMFGYRPGLFWVLSWNFVSPCVLLGVIILSIYNSERLSYYNYDYPTWATVLGWAFTLSSLSAIPIYAAIYFTKKLITIITNRLDKRHLNANCVDLKDISEKTNIMIRNDMIPKSNNSPIFV